MSALLGREPLLEAVMASLSAEGRVCLRGGRGVGRTRLLQAIRQRWEGPSLWIDRPGSEKALTQALDRLPGNGRWPGLLICVDDADAVEDPPALPQGAALVLVRRHGLERPGWTVVEVPPLPVDGPALELFSSLIEPWYPAGLPAPVREQAAGWVRAMGGAPLALAAAAGLWAVTGSTVAPLPLLPSTGAELSASWQGLDMHARAVLEAAAGFVGVFSVVDLLSLVPAHPTDLPPLVAGGWLRVERPGWLSIEPPVLAFLRSRGNIARDAAGRRILERARAEREALLTGSGSREWLLAAGPHLRVLFDEAIASGRKEDARAAFLALGAGLDDPAALLERADAIQALFPQDAEIGRELSRARRACGDIAGARAALEAALVQATELRLRAALLRELGVVHQRVRALDKAADAYQASLACAEAAGDPRATALAHGNLGTIAHDRRDLPEAEARYARALELLRAVGDRRMEATFLGNRGLLRQEAQALGDARRDLSRALSLLAGGADPRLSAIVLGNLGMLELEEGHPDEAAARLRQALQEIRHTADASTEALAWARLGAAEAERGQLQAAAEALDQAERRLAGTDDLLGQRLIELLRGFFAFARGRRGEAADRLARARATPAGQPALVERSDDARLATRILERRLLDRGDALAVGPGGTWFSLPGQPRTDLSRYRTCTRLLDALAEQRERAPGLPLDRDALVEAGWPGERIQASSATNRLHVGLARLRTEGLREVLLHVEGGWLLDPAWPLLRVREAG